MSAKLEFAWSLLGITEQHTYSRLWRPTSPQGEEGTQDSHPRRTTETQRRPPASPAGPAHGTAPRAHPTSAYPEGRALCPRRHPASLICPAAAQPCPVPRHPCRRGLHVSPHSSPDLPGIKQSPQAPHGSRKALAGSRSISASVSIGASISSAPSPGHGASPGGTELLSPASLLCCSTQQEQEGALCGSRGDFWREGASDQPQCRESYDLQR